MFFASRSLTRRSILRSALAAAAGGALAKGEQQPSLNFPKAPLERISVTSYPFRALIASPTNRAWKGGGRGMDLTEFAGMVLERFGVSNINPLGDHFASTEPAYLERFRRSLEKIHSHIVDLGLGGQEFYSADSATRTRAVEYGAKWIEIAAAVGSPSVRQHVHGAKGEEPNVERAAESLGRMAEFGAKHNIVVNLENDNPVAEGPFFLTSVIEKVNNPYLRALPDFGNSLLGHDAAFNRRAVAAMLDHVFNMCHVKQILEEDGKHYTVDLGELFAMAKQKGYPGYYSMECESEVEDPFTGTKHLIAETLKYLS